MNTNYCQCCKRAILVDDPHQKCWECRGRPATEGHVVPPAGLRDPKCPHALPETVR